MTKEVSYSQLFKESWSLTFRNYKVFFPIVLNLVFNVLMVPLMLYVSLKASTLTMKILYLAPFLIILLVASFIFSGYLYTLIRQIIQEKKLDLKGGFKKSFPMAWKFFRIWLVGVIAVIAVVLLCILCFLLVGVVANASKIAALALIVIFLLMFMAVFLPTMILLAAYSLQLFPVIILEDAGPLQSFAIAWRYFKNRWGRSILLFLLTLLIIFIAEIPYLIFYFAAMVSPIFFILVAFSMLPVIIASMIIMIMYCVDYQGQKSPGVKALRAKKV